MLQYWLQLPEIASVVPAKQNVAQPAIRLALTRAARYDMRVCPDATELAAFAVGQLRADARALVAHHIEACAECRAASSVLFTVSKLDDAQLASTATEPVSVMEPGATLGRFVVLHQLGAGAASVVYAAYDPALDRKVALKVLRAQGAGADDKLLREGRALAAVNHPNLVAVYEVGAIDQQLFIALQLVDGITIRQWLALATHDRVLTWREIRDVYLQAGRGLAALHQASLVHRDIKPDNIVVGSDGQARLVDLGLVGAGVGTGTPRYMAPEVRNGEIGDARSDQYSLALALQESLGTMRPPRRIAAALTKATAVAPNARFASTDELLHELQDPPRRWLPWAVAAGVVATATATAVTLAISNADPRAPSLCATAPDVVTASDIQAIDGAFASVALPYAQSSAVSARAGLQTFNAAWAAQWTQTCRQFHEAKQLTADQFARRSSCLQQQQASAGQLVTRLRHLDTASVRHVIELLHGLPAPVDCSDDTLLGRLEALPAAPALRALFIGLDAQLAQATLAQKAGDFDRARELAASVGAAARTLNYGSLVAKAGLLQGKLLSFRGDQAAALTQLQTAIEFAAAAKDDATEAQSWIERLYLLGSTARPEAAEFESARVAASAAAARSKQPMLQAALNNVLGLLAKIRGDYPLAKTLFEQALGLLKQAQPNAPEVAASLSNLSDVLAMLGDAPGALAAAQQAAARDREIFGPQHPMYAEDLVTLAARQSEHSEYAASLTTLLQAQAIVVAAHGEQTSQMLTLQNNLAQSYAQTGDPAKSLAAAQQAVVLAEALHGTSHRLTAHAYGTLANAAASTGDRASARKHAEHALALVEKLEGPGSLQAADLLANLGNWALEAHDAASAEKYLLRAVAAMGDMPNSPMLGAIDAMLASAYHAQHKLPQAATAAATALKLAQAAQDPLSVADAEFTLARVRFDQGARAEAIGLIEHALPAFVSAGPAGEEYIADLTAWAHKQRIVIKGLP